MSAVRAVSGEGLGCIGRRVSGWAAGARFVLSTGSSGLTPGLKPRGYVHRDLRTQEPTYTGPTYTATGQSGDEQNDGFGGGWGQTSNPTSGQGSGWLSSQAEQQFREQVLPRIEQEEARVQREIDRFLPPRTGR